MLRAVDMLRSRGWRLGLAGGLALTLAAATIITVQAQAPQGDVLENPGSSICGYLRTMPFQNIDPRIYFAPAPLPGRPRSAGQWPPAPAPDAGAATPAPSDAATPSAGVPGKAAPLPKDCHPVPTFKGAGV